MVHTFKGANNATHDVYQRRALLKDEDALRLAAASDLEDFHLGQFGLARVVNVGYLSLAKHGSKELQHVYGASRPNEYFGFRGAPVLSHDPEGWGDTDAGRKKEKLTEILGNRIGRHVRSANPTSSMATRSFDFFRQLLGPVTNSLHEDLGRCVFLRSHALANSFINTACISKCVSCGLGDEVHKRLCLLLEFCGLGAREDQICLVDFVQLQGHLLTTHRLGELEESAFSCSRLGFLSKRSSPVGKRYCIETLLVCSSHGGLNTAISQEPT
mmetsp:Transcript_65141/g.118855  ORF Transcript_65141/g.118855 Transcript_65141/m.118855 type:complete len:271 (+) Transcript_65141:229-1041(+)